MEYKFFLKKTATGTKENLNEVLPQKLHKPLIKIFKRRKVYVRFKYIIWVVDLVEMGSLSSKNERVKYLLWVTYCFSKYGWGQTLVSCHK